MGRRTGNPRGAPKGNTNRLKHGRWGREFATHKAEVDALLREARNAVIRANMVVRARRNLARVMAIKRNLPRHGFSPSPRGRGQSELAQQVRIGGGGVEAFTNPSPKFSRLWRSNLPPPARGGGDLWPNFYKTRAGPMDSFAAQTIGA